MLPSGKASIAYALEKQLFARGRAVYGQNMRHGLCRDLGFIAAFEAPANPDLTLPTHQLRVEESTERILGLLVRRSHVR